MIDLSKNASRNTFIENSNWLRSSPGMSLQSGGWYTEPRGIPIESHIVQGMLPSSFELQFRTKNFGRVEYFDVKENSPESEKKKSPVGWELFFSDSGLFTLTSIERT